MHAPRWRLLLHLSLLALAALAAAGDESNFTLPPADGDAPDTPPLGDDAPLRLAALLLDIAGVVAVAATLAGGPGGSLITFSTSALVVRAVRCTSLAGAPAYPILAHPLAFAVPSTPAHAIVANMSLMIALFVLVEAAAAVLARTSKEKHTNSRASRFLCCIRYPGGLVCVSLALLPGTLHAAIQSMADGCIPFGVAGVVLPCAWYTVVLWLCSVGEGRVHHGTAAGRHGVERYFRGRSAWVSVGGTHLTRFGSLYEAYRELAAARGRYVALESLPCAAITVALATSAAADATCAPAAHVVVASTLALVALAHLWAGLFTAPFRTHTSALANVAIACGTRLTTSRPPVHAALIAGACLLCVRALYELCEALLRPCAKPAKLISSPWTETGDDNASLASKEFSETALSVEAAPQSPVGDPAEGGLTSGPGTSMLLDTSCQSMLGTASKTQTLLDAAAKTGRKANGSVASRRGLPKNLELNLLQHSDGHTATPDTLQESDSCLATPQCTTTPCGADKTQWQDMSPMSSPSRASASSRRDVTPQGSFRDNPLHALRSLPPRTASPRVNRRALTSAPEGGMPSPLPLSRRQDTDETLPSPGAARKVAPGSTLRQAALATVPDGPLLSPSGTASFAGTVKPAARRMTNTAATQLALSGGLVEEAGREPLSPRRRQAQASLVPVLSQTTLMPACADQSCLCVSPDATAARGRTKTACPFVADPLALASPRAAGRLHSSTSHSAADSSATQHLGLTGLHSPRVGRKQHPAQLAAMAGASTNTAATLPGFIASPISHMSASSPVDDLSSALYTTLGTSVRRVSGNTEITCSPATDAPLAAMSPRHRKRGSTAGQQVVLDMEARRPSNASMRGQRGMTGLLPQPVDCGDPPRRRLPSADPGSALSSPRHPRPSVLGVAAGPVSLSGSFAKVPPLMPPSTLGTTL